MKLEEFTLYHFLNEYQKHTEIIDAYFHNKSLENFQYKDYNPVTISGLSIRVFIILFSIMLIFWIWALIVTIQFWNFIPTWAKIFALLGLFTGIGGPVLTLIIVYLSKSKNKIKR